MCKRKYKRVPATDLLSGEYDTLVADNRERSRLYLTGEPFESHAMPGFIGADTPFGTIYIDADLDVNVEVTD